MCGVGQLAGHRVLRALCDDGDSSGAAWDAVAGLHGGRDGRGIPRAKERQLSERRLESGVVWMFTGAKQKELVSNQFARDSSSHKNELTGRSVLLHVASRGMMDDGDVIFRRCVDNLADAIAP